MAGAFVQGNETRNFVSSTVAAPALTLTAGNTLIGFVFWITPTAGPVTLSSVGDGVNTYQALRRNPTAGRVQGANDSYAAAFFAYNVAAGSTTVTATFSGASVEGRIYAGEYSGIVSAGAFEADNINFQDFTGSGSDHVVSGTFSSATNNALIVGFTSDYFLSGSGISAGTGFGTADFSGNIVAESMTLATAGSTQALFNNTSNEAYLTYGASFNTGGGGGGSVVPVLMRQYRERWG